MIDTNVFISAVLGHGESRRIIELWLQGMVQLLVTAEIIEEYLEVLERFVPSHVLEGWEQRFYSPTKVSYIHQHLARLHEVRDEKDNKFVEAAFAGRAHYLISRDRDLTALGSFRGIPIQTPEVFLGVVQQAKER